MTGKQVLVGCAVAASAFAFFVHRLSRLSLTKSEPLKVALHHLPHTRTERTRTGKPAQV